MGKKKEFGLSSEGHVAATFYFCFTTSNLSNFSKRSFRIKYFFLFSYFLKFSNVRKN